METSSSICFASNFCRLKNRGRSCRHRGNRRRVYRRWGPGWSDRCCAHSTTSRSSICRSDFGFGDRFDLYLAVEPGLDFFLKALACFGTMKTVFFLRLFAILSLSFFLSLQIFAAPNAKARVDTVKLALNWVPEPEF